MKQSISITIDDKLIEELDRLAEKERRSRSNMIEILIEKQMEEDKSKDQE